MRVLGRISLAVSAAASVAVLPTSPASATTSGGIGDCPIASLCGWSQPGFQGQMVTFRAGGGCQESPIPLRSVANTHRSAIDVVMTVYSGEECSGKDLGTVGRERSLSTLPSAGFSVSSAW
ncbi:peptidase inhibitor family I36 protein [Actinomadura terrae]|uniref:peptidase inhibitor family I36 protein n=1 Tax=Actinomadura terrae TaxID=604353 RepID=UPI001FA6D8CD|nr:peptidase inhibitor family I36 protein [Actinomadura terrae]